MKTCKNSFCQAIKEWKEAKTINGTKPKLISLKNGEFLVTWFFSETTIKKMGGKIILLLCLCPLFSHGQWDKAAHFNGGGLISSSFQFCIEKNHNNQVFIGAGIAYGVGIGKEWWDSKGNGTVSEIDLKRTWQGGVFGSLSVKMSYNRQLFKYSKKKHYSTFWDEKGC